MIRVLYPLAAALSMLLDEIRVEVNDLRNMLDQGWRRGDALA
jgi:hypothetical protein